MKLCALRCIFSFLTSAAFFYGPGISAYRNKTDFKSIQFADGQSLQVSVETRVAVVIRAHLPYVRNLISLLWCLEAQDYSFNIYALIVPTERSSVKPLRERLLMHWHKPHNGLKRKVTAQLLELSELYYAENCCLLQKLCTAEWKARALKLGYGDVELQRHCSINTLLHYSLTDIALEALMSSCKTCIGVFVTNGDNSYAPSFISKTIPFLSSHSTIEDIRRSNDSLYEAVLVDMLHEGKAFTVTPNRGEMDLGCIMISYKFMNGTRTKFLSSLPSPAEPQDYYNADNWLVKVLIASGARIHVIHEVLFNHY